MKFKKNVLLKKYTTFQIGGPAKYFYIAKNKTELIEAIKIAKKLNPVRDKSLNGVKFPFFVLGGGSNLLISDRGFKGIVIKNEARSFKVKKEKIIAESGAILDRVIDAAVGAGLSGLEKGSGIPGTLGGAIYGNAGWPRGAWAIGDCVEKVELLMPNSKTKKVEKKWLSFGYRNSRLKEIKNENKKPVILEVVLKLKKGGHRDLEKRRREILKIRSKKIPPGFSAGSIFRNPSGFSAGELGEEDKSSSSAFAAARLIEECGLKGKKIGKAKISEKHANFIVNLGGATAKDVKKLINLTKKSVKKKFKINLEEEIQFL